MYTYQSALPPSSQRAVIRLQPALSACLSLSLLMWLAVTNVSAQSRAAQFRQMEAEQARAQRLRAEIPDLPYSIARGGDETEGVVSEKEVASAARLGAFGPVPQRWNQLAGPEAGRVMSLFENQGRVLAGTNGGVYYSDDQGLTWQRSPGVPAQFTSFSIVALGDALFIGTDGYSGGAGVYRSRDNGLTWEFLNNGLAETGGVFYLDVAPGNVLIASAAGGLVFRSTDNGESWQAAQAGLPDELGFVNATSNGRVTLATTGKGFFRSTDGGRSWHDINRNFPAGVAALPGYFLQVLGNRIWATGGKSGVLATDDDGATWRQFNNGLPADAYVGGVAVYGNEVYAALTDGSLYRSTDGGANWKKQSDTFSLGKTWHAAAKVGSALLVGTADGLYRSEDNGASWARSMEGMRIGFVDGGLLAVNNRLYVSVKGGVWASDNKGATWRLLNNGFRQYAFQSIEGGGLGIKDGVLFAGAYGDGLYRSFDGGGSWERLSNGLPERWSPSVVKTFNGKIYVGNWWGGVFVSADDGATWQAVKGLPEDAGFLIFTQLRPGVLLAGGYPGGIHRSDDDGQTWRRFMEGVDNEPLSNLVSDFVLTNTSVIAATEGGLFHLNEDETGWTPNLNYRAQARNGSNALIRQGRTIYSTSFSGIFVSYDNGATWGTFNQGMFTERGFYFADIKGDLFFGSAGAGMWMLRAPTSKTPPIIIPPIDDDESGDPFNDN